MLTENRHADLFAQFPSKSVFCKQTTIFLYSIYMSDQYLLTI